MIFGVPCAIDSLWAIKQMVFEDATAVTSLPELLECLFCDWGYDMIEPSQSSQGDPERSELKARRFKDLREIALKLHKFGSGHEEVDEFGGEIAARLKDITYEILSDPETAVSPEMKAQLDNLVERYSLPDQKLPGLESRPFIFHLMPAYGTFEDYLGLGLQNGASADGRRKGSSLSSNFSPMSSPMDLPPDFTPRDISKVLKGWNGSAFEDVLKIVAPVDIDIPEDTPHEVLIKVLHSFRLGELGSNMLSITCADRETLAKAQKYPERYDLLRLRYGGWSEYFIGMYNAHQEQHLRRPLFADLSHNPHKSGKV
jgi:autonomous glycyl radical cofactor GrcA